MPQRPQVAAPSWAVVRADGGLAMEVLPLAQTRTLRDNLDKLARRDLVRSLQNPGSRFVGQVDFNILVKDASDAWVRAASSSQESLHLKDGTPIALELCNRTGSTLYISVLFLDANGAINSVYPPVGGEGALRPGPALSIGNHPGQSLIVRFPKDLSFALDAEGNAPQAVTDYLKLIVSTQPLDVRSLLQSAVSHGQHRGQRAQGVPPTATILGRLLADILAGQSTVRSLDVEMPAAEDWSTEIRTLRVKRSA